VDTVKLLLDRGADPRQTRIGSGDGRTPLMVAIQLGRWTLQSRLCLLAFLFVFVFVCLGQLPASKRFEPSNYNRIVGSYVLANLPTALLFDPYFGRALGFGSIFW
jgi:hypothetical protein